MPESTYSKQKINHLIDCFEGKRILIIGDVMVDAYWWGKISRISPEAPVPIISVKEKEFRLGGAANVAMNIKNLGGIPLLASVIGNDAEGDIFLGLLKKESLDTNLIIKNGTRPTTVKSRIIANNQQQVLRVDNETESLVSADLTNELKEKIVKTLETTHAIIFEDYDKGVIGEELIKFVTEKAGEKKIPIVVDPKKRNFFSYNNVSLFKPNLKELREGLNLPLQKPLKIEELRDACNLLFEKMNIGIAFITLSEDGVYINNRSEEYLIPAHKRSVFDVSGAGDTVASVAGLAMACGHSLKLLAELTNIAGGLVCEDAGVVPIDKGRFKEECARLLF